MVCIYLPLYPPPCTSKEKSNSYISQRQAKHVSQHEVIRENLQNTTKEKRKKENAEQCLQNAMMHLLMVFILSRLLWQVQQQIFCEKDAGNTDRRT